MSELVIHNHGPLITRTNYWKTELARAWLRGRAGL